MPYWLGIDVGSTFTAAAICREQFGRRSLPEVVPLGSRSAAVSSVIYLGQDGQVFVGEAAERRAVTHPDRVVREFTRRIGDQAPLVFGGVRYSASQLAALVLRWVIDRVAQIEGGSAQGITITHPAGWAAEKIQSVADALRAADLAEVMFCTEPEAAAASYSIHERIESGSTIAVYDLGGGTFDAAVVCKTTIGTFSVLGVPERIERLGGVDFDDAVFRHVVAAVPALSGLDSETTAGLAATARLRRSVALCRLECTEAKETLSTDTEVTIPVLLSEAQSQVRLVRAEFEDLIRPLVAHTAEALRRALRSAEVRPEDLDAVLLVGGSSRVPLVAQLVSAELGRPVTVDANPQATIALGAALSGLPAQIVHPADIDTAGADVRSAPTTVEAGGFAGPEVPEPAQAEVPHPPSPAAIPWHVEPTDIPRRQGTSRRVKRFAAAGVLLLAGGAASMAVMTSHRSPITPTAGGTPAPAPAVPVTSTPAPNLGSIDSLRSADATVAAPTTSAAAPDEPPSGPADPAAAVPAPHPTRVTSTRRTTSRSKPAASTTSTPPPPPAHIPAWVEAVR